MQNEILKVINPRKNQRSHFNVFEDCFSSRKTKATSQWHYVIGSDRTYPAYLGRSRWLDDGNEVMGSFEPISPIESFLQREFEVTPDVRTLNNFKIIVESALSLSIIELIEDDDIYVEENGAISLEIYKDDLKTFISIGKESFGYYIRKDSEIIDKQNDVPLIFWGNPFTQTTRLKSNLALYYLNPTLSKHSFRLTYGI